MLDAVAIYAGVVRRAVEQLTRGKDPGQIEAAAEQLRYLDPTHPALPALYERRRRRRIEVTLH